MQHSLIAMMYSRSLLPAETSIRYEAPRSVRTEYSVHHMAQQSTAAKNIYDIGSADWLARLYLR